MKDYSVDTVRSDARASQDGAVRDLTHTFDAQVTMPRPDHYNAICSDNRLNGPETSPGSRLGQRPGCRLARGRLFKIG